MFVSKQVPPSQYRGPWDDSLDSKNLKAIESQFNLSQGWLPKRHKLYKKHIRPPLKAWCESSKSDPRLAQNIVDGVNTFLEKKWNSKKRDQLLGLRAAASRLSRKTACSLKRSDSFGGSIPANAARLDPTARPLPLPLPPETKAVPCVVLEKPSVQPSVKLEASLLAQVSPDSVDTVHADSTPRFKVPASLPEEGFSEALRFEPGRWSDTYEATGKTYANGAQDVVRQVRCKTTDVLRVLKSKTLKDASAYREVFALQSEAAQTCPFLAHSTQVFLDDTGLWPVVHIIMEAYADRDLLDFLQPNKQDPRRPLGTEDIRIIAAELVVALQALHAAGIVHRDIKPSNVFFSSDMHVRLGDFGLSRGTATRPTSLCIGTVLYFAPEIIGAEAGYDTACDLWSLGVLLYECATGEFPFMTRSRQPADIMQAIARGQFTWPQAKAVDPDLKDLVGLLLKRDARQRLKLGAVMEHPFFAQKIDWRALEEERHTGPTFAT